jgi:hypothetical protein
MRFKLWHWVVFEAICMGLMVALLRPALISDDVLGRAQVWMVMFFMFCFVSLAMVLFDLSEKEREGRVNKLVTLRQETEKQAKAVVPQPDGRVVMFMDDRVRIYDTDNRYREILYINIKWFAGMMDQLGVKV